MTAPLNWKLEVIKTGGEEGKKDLFNCVHKE